MLGGREDRRALALGGFFLAAAPAWCNAPLGDLAEGGLGRVLLDLVIALKLRGLPRLLPVGLRARVPQPAARRCPPGAASSSWRGSAPWPACCSSPLNLLAFRAAARGSSRRPAGARGSSPQRGKGIFYGVVLALTAAAFLLLPWKARQAQGPEHRRARVFLEILGLTFGPIILELLLGCSSPATTISSPPVRGCNGTVTIVLLPALTLPFTIPYAVLVHRVLDVRLIARRALQYLLARSTVTALVAVPLAALGLYAWIHRDEQVDRALLRLAGAAAARRPSLVGAAALRYRKPLLDAIDRRFFREQFDARQHPHPAGRAHPLHPRLREPGRPGDAGRSTSRSIWRGSPSWRSTPARAPRRPPPPDAAPGRLLARSRSPSRTPAPRWRSTSKTPTPPS